MSGYVRHNSDSGAYGTASESSVILAIYTANQTSEPIKIAGTELIPPEAHEIMTSSVMSRCSLSDRRKELPTHECWREALTIFQSF